MFSEHIYCLAVIKSKNLNYNNNSTGLLYWLYVTLISEFNLCYRSLSIQT